MAILNDLLVNGISRFVGPITADEIRGLGANYYGVCDTAAATNAKVVTCAGFVLKTGVRISVKFTNGSTSSSNMTLDVNGTGAKTCGVYLYNNTWQALTNRCDSNTVLEFMYNGTYWIVLTPYTLRNFGTYSARITSANRSFPNFGLEYFLATSSMTTGKPPTDAHILNFNWDNGTTHTAQLAIGHGTSGVIAGRLFTRGQPDSSTWSSWLEVPRLSGALTNNQIVVSDESTGNALLKGGPTIGTGTTKFLREDGTWQTPNGTGTPYIDLGSAALSTGTSTTTGISYTLTFTSATSALSSVTAPTIVMFTTIIDGAAAAFVGQYTRDLVVSPTTFKQIVGTCVIGTETKTFKVSIVPGMTTGTLLIDDVANIWKKTTSGGIVFFNEGVDTSDYQVGDIIDIGKDIPTSVITTSDGSNRLIIGPGTTQFGSGLDASVSAGSTSYVFSSAWKIAPNGSTNVDFLKDIYFYVRGQNVAAQKPTDAQVVNGKVTLTFSSSLNPISAATGIWGSCYSEGYNSILVGTGVSQVGGAISIICAMATKTSGFYNSIIGQSIENTGSASSIVAVRAKNTGNYSAIVGSDLVNAKNYATLFGLGHDSTSGPAAVTAVGQYSNITSTTLFAVGKGTAASTRSNAFEVHTDGRATVGAAPTADMDVATKKYVDDNSGGGGGGSSNTIIISTSGWTVTLDQTADAGTIVSGDLGSGTYSSIATQYASGTKSIIIDDSTNKFGLGSDQGLQFIYNSSSAQQFTGESFCFVAYQQEGYRTLALQINEDDEFRIIETNRNLTKVFYGTCSTAAATVEKAVTCPEFSSSDLVTGAIVFVTFTATNSGDVSSIKLNVNSTGAKNIRFLTNAAVTTIPSAGYIIANMTYRFVYNGTYWVMDLYYNTNDNAYVVRNYYMNRYTGSQAVSPYKIMLVDGGGHYIPYTTATGTSTYTKAPNTTPFNPFAGIYFHYANSTISANSKPANAEVWYMYSYGYANVQYSFNINSGGTAGTTALTANKPVYIRAKYNFATGMATLAPGTSSSNYLEASAIVQALPTTNPNSGDDFYIYIFMGYAYDKYRATLELFNEVYAWNSIQGAITPFHGAPFNGSGTFTAYYGTNSATWTYVKQGRLVTVQGTIPNGTSMAATSITSLPFAASGNQKIMATASQSSYLIHSFVISLSDGGTSFTPLTMLYSTTGGTSHTAMNSTSMIFYTCGDNATTVNFTYVTNY